jgi:hypothetical protein
MRATFGVSGFLSSKVFRTRDVVDFPTATLPAIPMMKGVWRRSSPRNWRVM